jgi:hypothetical protein
MEHSNGYAEQCKDCSDRFTDRINCHTARAAAQDRQAAARPQPAGHPRIIDHAVHAVWQTALPLCGRTRAWSQILPLGEQSREPPHTPLYTPNNGRAGSGAVGPSAEVSHPPGGAVRHRLRVAHTPCRPVARPNVVGQPNRGGVCNRCGCRQSTRGQHVRTRHERPPLARSTTRGGSPCARR